MKSDQRAILGIDRFMSMFRALINMVGNGVAALVVARWEKEIDSESLHRKLAAAVKPRVWPN